MPIKTKTFAQIASDRLLNREITCAGCQYRVMVSKNKDVDVTDHCERGMKPPAPFRKTIYCTSNSTPEYKTICPKFKGVLARDIGDHTFDGTLHPQRIETNTGTITFYALHSPQKFRILKRFRDAYFKSSP